MAGMSTSLDALLGNDPAELQENRKAIEGEHQCRIHYAMGWWLTVTRIVEEMEPWEQEAVRLRAGGMTFQEVGSAVQKPGNKSPIGTGKARDVERRVLRAISRATMMPTPEYLSLATTPPRG